MEEALNRALAHSLSNAASHGQMDFGSAFIIFILISGGIAVLSYGIKEARKGQPGCLITSLAAGVLLIVMLSSCQ